MLRFKERRIFLSHTRSDKDFCDRFDNAAASEGVGRFRSEFESLEAPAWKTIKEEIKNSYALFLLVGKELVSAQEQQMPDWKYTQNWIAYEVGLACQRGIDVWVWCDSIPINFPVPYLNNYVQWGYYPLEADGLKFLREVLRAYKLNTTFPLGWRRRDITCPTPNCGATYNLHGEVEKGQHITCPTCLKPMWFSDGYIPP